VHERVAYVCPSCMCGQCVLRVYAHVRGTACLSVLHRVWAQLHM